MVLSQRMWSKRADARMSYGIIIIIWGPMSATSSRLTGLVGLTTT